MRRGCYGLFPPLQRGAGIHPTGKPHPRHTKGRPAYAGDVFVCVWSPVSDDRPSLPPVHWLALAVRRRRNLPGLRPAHRLSALVLASADLQRRKLWGKRRFARRLSDSGHPKSGEGQEGLERRGHAPAGGDRQLGQGEPEGSRIQPRPGHGGREQIPFGRSELFRLCGSVFSDRPGQRRDADV